MWVNSIKIYSPHILYTDSSNILGSQSAVRITLLSADPDLEDTRISNDTFLVVIRTTNAFILSVDIGRLAIVT